jgi:hypothetical protein
MHTSARDGATLRFLPTANLQIHSLRRTALSKRYCCTPGFVVAIGEIEGGDNTQNILSDGGLCVVFR